MGIRYYPDTDSLYIDLAEAAESRPPSLKLRTAPSEALAEDGREAAPGVVPDFDAEGQLVGIDMDHASKVVDLSHLETESMPFAPAAPEEI